MRNTSSVIIFLKNKYLAGIVLTRELRATALPVNQVGLANADPRGILKERLAVPRDDDEFVIAVIVEVAGRGKRTASVVLEVHAREDRTLESRIRRRQRAQP